MATRMVQTPVFRSALLTVEVFAPGEIEDRLVCGEYTTADEDGITVIKGGRSTDTGPWAEVGEMTAVGLPMGRLATPVGIREPPPS